MKKALSIFLAVMLTVFSTIPAFAATAKVPTEKDRLYALLDSFAAFGSMWGEPRAYRVTGNEYNDAWNVYDDPDSTEEDYALACDEFLEVWLNFDIYPSYAKAAYEMALKEKNYNNYYSDEDWTNFQSKLKDLGDVIDSLGDSQQFSSDLTKAFHAMLKAYNKMTNAYTLKGDLNNDGSVNVADVTLLQKYLAGTEELTGAQKMLTGAYIYEDLSITDATLIQKYSVQLIEKIPNNTVFVLDLGVFYMDEDLLMERVFNFNICPRILPEAGIRSDFYNGYANIGCLSSYYYWCYENNFEP